MSFNESDARKFYGILGHHQTEYTELRAFDPAAKEMREREFVKNETEFIQVCQRWSGKYHVYAGLNPRREKAGKNEDVTRRTTILVDIDRHHGDDGATEQDLADAKADADKVVEHLKQGGHPEPWVDMSGNGYHLILSVNLPTNATTTDRIKEFYRTLPSKTDEANADLARLCKVAGTMSLRGTPRLSYLVNPGTWENDTVLEAYLTQSQTPDVKQEPQTKTSTTELDTKTLRKYRNKMRPCIRAMLTNDNPGAHGESGELDHEAHLLIVKDAQFNGLGEREICALFITQPDYRKGVTERYVRTAIQDNAQKGVTPWYCNNLIERGWCTAEDPEACAFMFNDPAQPHKKRVREDKAAKLILLARENALEFFRDQYQTGYATLPCDSMTAVTPLFEKNAYSFSNLDSREVSKMPVTAVMLSQTKQTVPLNSKQFKWWLARLYHVKTKSAVGRDYLNSAIFVLEAETQTKPVRFLYNRAAPNSELSYWWDMGDERGRAIHVDRDGWRVDENPPQIFRRYPHTLPLSEPARGGSLEPFLDYLSLEEAGDRLLAIVAAISYLVPEVPHIGTTVTGRQGSGKSTFHRLLQGLVDPSSVDLLTLPTKDDDLVQVLEHHYLAIFDNVNSLTRTQSDILCRAITGAGNEKRELYTTDDSFIRQFIRCVGLNGISVPIEKSDLFSRNLLLPWVPITSRRTDAEMKAQMQRDAPGLIGAMLDVFVEACRLYPETRTRLNVRMADFAKWGCAITRALGLRQEAFEQAYLANLRVQDEEAVRASMVAETIIRYMRLTQRTRISGSATELKAEIEEWANPPDERGRPIGDLLSKRVGWPKNPPAFGKDLLEVAPALEATGYRVGQSRTGKARVIVVERLVEGDAPREVAGQRTFGSVSVEELTDSRLRAALIDAADRFSGGNKG